jgi:hypothetical protein
VEIRCGHCLECRAALVVVLGFIYVFMYLLFVSSGFIYIN